MARALRQFAQIVTDGAVSDPRDLDWASIGYGDVTRARAAWVEKYAPAGAKVRLAAVRGALKAAWRMGQISADDYMRAIDVPAVRGESLPAGRALDDAEIVRLLESCADGKRAGVRDAAVIAVFRTGCRVDELCQLDFHDYFPSLADAGEPATFKIHGKGRRERLAYLDPLYDQFVRRWVEIRGDSSGPLFCPMDPRGNAPLLGKRMRRQGINHICVRRAAAAGIEHFSPHDMRRTVATELRERGVDLVDIRDVLGHRDLETTAGYFRGEKELAKRRAAAVLSGRLPPKRRPT